VSCGTQPAGGSGVVLVVTRSGALWCGSDTLDATHLVRHSLKTGCFPGDFSIGGSVVYWEVMTEGWGPGPQQLEKVPVD
jgi:hypothetical protein